MFNFTVAYLGVCGYSSYTNNWWPIGIIIGVLTAIIFGLSVQDMMDRWTEK